MPRMNELNEHFRNYLENIPSESWHELLNSQFYYERLVILYKVQILLGSCTSIKLSWNVENIEINLWGRDHNWIFLEQNLIIMEIFRLIIKIKWYWLLITTCQPCWKHQGLLGCYTQLKKWCWTMGPYFALVFLLRFF